MKRTVINMLSLTAQEFPDFNYLNEKTDNGWTPTTFKQTDELTNFVALGLMDLGFKPFDKVALLSEGRTAWVLSELGALKYRMTVVPLSVKLLPEELIFRLNHSESKAIFISKNHIDKIIRIYHSINAPDFKIILLDNLTDDLLEKLKQAEIPSKNFLTFNGLINRGKAVFDKRKPELDNIIEQIEEDDVVTISYTSGTTGDPKGIMLMHKNYWHNVTQALEHFKEDMPRFAKNLIILPLDHSFAHTAGIYAALRLPYSLYFLDARGGAMAALRNIPINLQEVEPDFLFTVPALTGNFMNKIQENIRKQSGFVQWLFNLGLNAGIKRLGDGYKDKPFFLVRWILAIPHGLADVLIFKKIRASFGNYRYSIGGGALLDIAQQRFFASIGMPIYQGYGLTEATPIISANTPALHKFGSSGKPMPMMDIKIISEGKEQPIGQKGEIVIRGDNVMKGYFKNPEATAKTIRDGWLYTGDMGYIDQDGFLVVTGREKALLISQDGEKYSPEEIEETIASTSPFVYQIMLYNDHSKYTTAIITLNEDYIRDFIRQNNVKTPEELIYRIEKSLFEFRKDKVLRDKFPQRWLPSVFAIAPEPFTEQNKMLNSTMKIVRYRIIEHYHDLIDSMYAENAGNVSNHNINVLKKFFAG